MLTLFDHTKSELSDWCKGLDVSPRHADELMRSLYKKYDLSPWETSKNLPRIFAERGPSEFCEIKIAQDAALESQYDGSVKFLWRLDDGSLIESVLMPEKSRITLCVSSQVGCAQACTFCHTGRMGLKRNLTAGEIVAQVYFANAWIRENTEWLVRNRLPTGYLTTNIVFMGMGEPLDNVANVIQSIRIVTDPLGLAIGMRHISVSTAGHLDGMRIILEKLPQVRLALSLHSPFEGERSKIMPINRKWPLREVLEALRFDANVQKNGLLIQYTLIRGVNDSVEHAKALQEILQGIPTKINLIPLNEIEPSRFQSPDPMNVQAFQDVLYKAGMRTMVRYSKGQDIAGACGQLAVILSEAKDLRASS